MFALSRRNPSLVGVPYLLKRTKKVEKKNLEKSVMPDNKGIPTYL